MSEKKISQFFEDKGFYIVLFLCVVAIGTAAYVLFLSPETPDTTMSSPPSTTAVSDAFNSDEYNQSQSIEVAGVPKATTKAPPETTAASTAAATVATKATTVKPKTKPATTAATTANKPVTFFVKPVMGKIAAAFSGDELVYDRTNGDWRTHNGVDFECTEGQKVMAIADGIIEDVYSDDYYGTSVLIDHGNELKSIYLGLVSEASVYKGQPVTAGTVIGAVNSDVLFESSMPVHFHLEITSNGERVDPMSLLPT